MAGSQILIVEDEEDIALLVSRTLAKEGFETFVAPSLAKAQELLETQRPHLVILDLMLPDGDGLELCRQLKQETPDIAVIILTAKGEEGDRVLGLELGADDYIVKPFSPRELALRVKAVLRRFKGAASLPEETHQIGDLTLDISRHQALVQGKPIHLTRTEFALLLTLFESRGKVLTREVLLDRVWGYTFEGYARTVDTHIRRLRKKLGPCAGLIETVWGLGYRFKAQ